MRRYGVSNSPDMEPEYGFGPPDGPDRPPLGDIAPEDRPVRVTFPPNEHGRVATGHLTCEEALELGDRITIGGLQGIVRAVEAVLGERERRLAVQLLASTSRRPSPSNTGRNWPHELGDQLLCALETLCARGLPTPTLSSRVKIAARGSSWLVVARGFG